MGSNKKPIARLGRNYDLSYEDMPQLIPYEPIHMVADAREFLEVMGVKKADKIAGLLNENPAKGLRVIEAYADKNNFKGVLSLPSPQVCRLQKCGPMRFMTIEQITVLTRT